MPNKLTVENITGRLLPRDIKIVGDFINVQTKTTFECANEHQWSAKPNNVLAGHGCPECRKISKEDINQRLMPRSITMVGELIDTKNKSMFRCLNGHEWESKVNNVLNGCGCPECYRTNKRLTLTEINDRISDRLIRMSGDYTLASEKTAFTCMKCEYVWQAIPNNIMSGSGCPCCVEYGFNSAAESTVYLLEYDDFVKIGITNSFERRYAELAKGYKSQPINVIRRDVTSGVIARNIERVIKNKFTGGYKTSVEYPNGYTETFSKDIMSELLKIIEGELNVIR